MTLQVISTRLADVSDRAARLLGGVNIYRSGFTGTPAMVEATTGDGLTDRDALWSNSKTLLRGGTAWDRACNLLPGAPKRALSVGGPTLTSVYGAALWGTVLFERVPGAAGQYPALRLRNPAGSGKRTVVTYLEVLCNAARRVDFMNAGAGLADLASALGLTNKLLGTAGAPSSTTSQTNNAAVVGSTFHGLTLQAGVPYAYYEPIIVPADRSLDILFDDAGTVLTDKMTVQIEFYEEAN